MVPADLFAGITADAGDTGDGEAGTDPLETADEGETFEAPESLEGAPPAGDEETGDTAPPAEEAVPAEPADQAKPADAGAEKKPPAAAEELPDGVIRGKDRNGKPGLFVKEERWNQIHGNHKLIQDVSEIIGEPATAEALKLRNDAYLAQERMFTELLSGDPGAQSSVLNYFFDEMSRERESGGVAADPAVPFAQSFYSTLQQRAPDAYAHVRLMAARDLIGEVFREAASSGDPALFVSAQHVARMLSGIGKDVKDISQVRAVAERMQIPFYLQAEMDGLTRGADPLAQLRAENQQLRNQVEGRSVSSQAAQFDQWHRTTSAEVQAAVLDDAIRPALASVESGWKDFPDDYKRLVVDPLHREVNGALRSDPVLAQRLQPLNDQARRATSAQRRDELRQQIRQTYVNRAKQITEARRGPVLSFAAKWLEERSSQNHRRLQGAQTRTLPRGATGQVPRSLVPPGGNQNGSGKLFDPGLAKQEARRALFGG